MKETAACMVFTKAEPVYTDPCDSRIIDVYKVRLSNGMLKYLSLDTTAFKALCHADEGRDCLIFMQLLHVV
jgi:hypothetical protein